MGHRRETNENQVKWHRGSEPEALAAKLPAESSLEGSSRSESSTGSNARFAVREELMGNRTQQLEVWMLPEDERDLSRLLSAKHPDVRYIDGVVFPTSSPVLGASIDTCTNKREVEVLIWCSVPG